MKLKDLGFSNIVVDEEAIPYLLRKIELSELEEFSGMGKIHVIGDNAGDLKGIVNESDGIIHTKKDTATDVTSSVRSRKHRFIDWSRTFSINPRKVKSQILYVKFVNHSVITDLPTFFTMKFQEYIRRKDCYLRLIAHGMENCPHNCAYCYANYAYDVPTTVIVNFKERLRKDIKGDFSAILKGGFPINIGSITDPFSDVAVYFNIVADFLEEASNINSLIVTKSIRFADDKWILFLKRHRKLKITFTYTGLSNYEMNIPYDNRKFPEPEISKAVKGGLDINVFCRPIVKHINDSSTYLRNLFLAMKSADIEHVCVGFLRSNERMKSSLAGQFPEQFRRITRNLTDKYVDDFYPPLRYRLKKLSEIHNILYHNNMLVSTCQPYVGEYRKIVENTCCSCRGERWSL